MKQRNRIAFFNILSTVVLKGSAFFTGMLFSRLLGGSGYGSLKLYNISVSIVTILFSLQTQTTLANARVEFPEGEQPAYQSSVMALSVLSFGVGGVLMLLLIDGQQEEFQALRDFNRKVDLPTKLSDIGVTVADVEKAAPEVVKDADLEHYPYRVTEDMIVEAARRLDTAE